MDEVEFGGAGEVANREYRTQRLFQARDIVLLLVGAQELLVALALDLDQIGHLDDFMRIAEDLADAALGRTLGCRTGRGLAGALVGRLRLGSHKEGITFAWMPDLRRMRGGRFHVSWALGTIATHKGRSEGAPVFRCCCSS